MNSLKDVYLDQLRDLHSANTQALEVVRDLAGAATSDSLRRALERGVSGIEDGRGKLATLITGHGADPSGEHCKGMEGLAREAKAHALGKSFADDDARDAMIIAQYQRMAHYAIAGYGCVAAFARQLGLTQEAGTLAGMLEAAHSGDQTMSRIAEEKVNERAA